jgi:site-specific DNA-cytosine methylase
VRVLVLCEFSGTVRDAFLVHGHDAASCDLLPTERPGPHFQGDCRDLDYTGVDLIIAHPPCTHLAVSGARYFAQKKAEQEAALAFVRWIMDLSVPRICLENPVGIISSRVMRPAQIIQPWQFGHPESKTTCLWLNNLPLLIPTEILEKPACGYWANQTPSGQNKLGPSPERAKNRGRTYAGIAWAMAMQWGGRL